MAKDTPAAEVDVTPELVRSLVDGHFPRFGGLELSLVGNGWDNSMYRLGDEHVVRVPRRALAAPLILNEQRWLPELAPRLSLDVSVPIGFGQPTDFYQWHWTISKWFDGVPALKTTLNDRQPAVLAQFLSELHKPAPASAPENRFRGTPLSSRYRTTLQYVDDLSSELSLIDDLTWTVQEALASWDAAVRVEDYDGPPLWLHGDLHPLNVVVLDNALAAVIDFGDITSGDPATDIAAGWMLFDQEQLAAFRRALDCDDDTWHRARGWAISLGFTYLAHSADNPVMAQMGHRTLATALGPQA